MRHDTTQSLITPLFERDAGDLDDLGPGVHLWLAELDRIAAGPEALSAEERRKAAGFGQGEMRQRYLATRFFCRQLLSRYSGTAPEKLELSSAGNGKPYLPGNERLQFNLSHSGSLALLAIGNGRAVGIDLEPVRPRPNRVAIARRVLDESTVAALAAIADEGEQTACFTQAWTAFEARQKLTGNGIFGPRTVPAHRLIPFVPRPGWQAALAVEGEADPPLRFFEY